jgi:hypothetical protein
MAKLIIGNTKLNGFVNFVAGNRLVVGTGSFTTNGGEKVYKESVTVFKDDKFDGGELEKGDYVTVSGDLVISERKDKPEELQATVNVRFANQLVKTEAPKKKESADAPASADAAGDI